MPKDEIIWQPRGRIYWLVINFLGESLAKIHSLVYCIYIVRNVIHFVLYTVLGRRGEDSLTSNYIDLCILGQASNAEKFLLVILIGQLCKKVEFTLGSAIPWFVYKSKRNSHILSLVTFPCMFVCKPWKFVHLNVQSVSKMEFR